MASLRLELSSKQSELDERENKLNFISKQGIDYSDGNGARKKSYWNHEKLTP